MSKKDKILEIEALLRGEFPDKDKTIRHFGNVNELTVEQMKAILLPEDYFAAIDALPEEEVNRQLEEWRELDRKRKERPTIKF